MKKFFKKIADTDTLDMSNLTGATVQLSAASGGGLITAVADQVGGYSVSVSVGSINVITTNNSGKGLLGTVDLSGLSAPTTSTPSNNNTTITDFYGYVVDLAFRTNVSANLQMQAAAVDRIYTDGAGATAGKGTGVIYTAPAGMNDTQINSMLSAMRAVFFDPDSGTIYATGKLGKAAITAGADANAGRTACRTFLW